MAQKRKILHITEDQLNGIIYNLDSPNETPEYTGQKYVKSDGYVEQGEDGKPTTGDKFGKMLCPQTYGRFGGIGVYVNPNNIGDDTIDNDEDDIDYIIDLD